MSKYLKYMAWAYLAAFLFLVLGMIFLGVYTRTSSLSSLAWNIGYLVPVVVLYRWLKNKSTPLLFSAIGFVVLLPPILEAHRFLAIENVTVGMYVWLVPMAALMVWVFIQGFKNET